MKRKSQNLEMIQPRKRKLEEFTQAFKLHYGSKKPHVTSASVTKKPVVCGKVKKNWPVKSYILDQKGFMGARQLITDALNPYVANVLIPIILSYWQPKRIFLSFAISNSELSMKEFMEPDSYQCGRHRRQTYWEFSIWSRRNFVIQLRNEFHLQHFSVLPYGNFTRATRFILSLKTAFQKYLKNKESGFFFGEKPKDLKMKDTTKIVYSTLSTQELFTQLCECINKEKAVIGTRFFDPGDMTLLWEARENQKIVKRLEGDQKTDLETILGCYNFRISKNEFVSEKRSF